jgi:hypothetical protein
MKRYPEKILTKRLAPLLVDRTIRLRSCSEVQHSSAEAPDPVVLCSRWSRKSRLPRMVFRTIGRSVTNFSCLRKGRIAFRGIWSLLMENRPWEWRLHTLPDRLFMAASSTCLYSTPSLMPRWARNSNGHQVGPIRSNASASVWPCSCNQCGLLSTTAAARRSPVESI